MSDRGIKLAKDGKTIASTNPDDYNLWTKYPPLSFLEKKTVEITIGPGNCGYQTEDVDYDYDFIPLVLGIVSDADGNRYFMPAEDFVVLNCDWGLFSSMYFNYKIVDGKVVIEYFGECAEMGYSECPLSNHVFTVDLYFYIWEMGSKWPE
jgi:hypothetical protein